MRRAVLLHATRDVSANIRWLGVITNGEKSDLTASLAALRARGYWASAFPEGDGVAFSHANYDRSVALGDVTLLFPWVEIQEADPSAMGEAFAGALVTVRFLTPVLKLQIDRSFTLGPYRFNAPVDGVDNTVDRHEWKDELLDEPGADVNPSWRPNLEASDDRGRLARLLGRPLIDASTQVDASLLVGRGVAEQDILVRTLTEHADRGLDLLRWSYCHHRRPEYTPDPAGLTADGFSEVYLLPSPGIRGGLLSAITSPIATSNRWLGLEIEGKAYGNRTIEELARIAAGVVANPVEARLRAALRIRNQAFFIVSAEMRFLSLILAIDSVAWVGRLKGNAQREYVARLATLDRPAGRAKLQTDFDELYGVRNKIVHEGASFAELGLDAAVQLDGADAILRSCIDVVVSRGFVSRVALERALAP